MGHQKKGFNAKARTVSSNNQKQNTQKIDIVVDVSDKEKYDASNPLVLVSKKKKVKVEEKKDVISKPLSKNQRRKLQKVIESKKKKLNRAELFEKLSAVQAKAEDLSQLTSTADMQTYGIKRLMNEVPSHSKRQKISNIKGINKKSGILSNEQSDESGNSSSSDSEDISEEEDKLESGNDTTEIASLTESNSDKDEKPEYKINVISLEKDEKLTSENVIIENTGVFHLPTVFVPVNRIPEIQAAREALPIFSEEQPLIEAIKENPVVIVHGETGSGKTTQVPQFLYEAGFTQNNMLIGITEPRRIAAMSMAARVGQEMNMHKAVSYHIRYEKSVNPETRIKFMTDGVLLKEIKHDFYLSKYSVIIIDEAHERSVFSDVLIGLLSRIIRRSEITKKKYPPLKLIIMSATMCVEEFMENPRLFRTTPSLFQVSSRQYDVQVHFNKHTPDDYVEAAYNKVCKIHRQLPSGAILVFLTGEKEIKRLCKMLSDTFPSKDSIANSNLEPKEEFSKNVIKEKKKHKKDQPSFLPDIDLDDFAVEPLDADEAIDDENDAQATTSIVKKFEDATPLCALPLYSVLPLEEQEKVFKPPPTGSRLCVVATNVAETSITIPGLKYVVDSGKVKTKVYNRGGGISQFVVTWCSKASANQRTGRAGRTEGGHCYRLYSSAMFENEFPDFSLPEIQRTPADDVLLQMKALGIPKVIDFPFPSPPDTEALKAAEQRLVLLEALEDVKNKGGRYKDCKEREFSAPATDFGKAMALFPLSPRYSAMLLLSKKHKCVPYAVAIICAMTVPEVFQSTTVTTEDNNEENSETTKVVWNGIKRIGAGTGTYLRLGDAMVLLRAVVLYEESKNKVKFCIKNNIRHRAMAEIHKMCIQLLREMNQAFSNLDVPLTLQLEHPAEETIEKLRKIIAAGFVDHIARKLPAEEGKKDKKLKNAYKCMELEEPVFIHPSSILFDELPEYVVYQEIFQTSKYYMKGVIEIENHWIPGLAPTLCEFSDPREDPPPYYDSEREKIFVTMDVTVGRWSWEICARDIEMPIGQSKYQWFCFFLLDGQICPLIKKYRQFLEPSTVLKKWARTLKPHVMHFLTALILEEVDCRKSLEKVWERNSKYLLREFLALLPTDKHLEIESKWPPKS